MTCIVAVREEGHPVVMGADSCGSNHSHKDVYEGTKMFRTGLYVIGFTSTFRWGQILETDANIRQFLLANTLIDGELYLYLAGKFIPILRKAVDTSGHMGKKEGVESGGVCLIAILDKLATIHSDFSVLPSNGYAAVGSGTYYATGSLFTTKKMGGVSSIDRVKLALEAASEHNPFVGPPFEIMSTAVLLEDKPKRKNKSKIKAEK